MISTDDKKEVRDLVLEVLKEQKDYYLTQRDKTDILEKISDLKTELNEKISGVEVKLIDRINDLRTELFKYVDSKLERQTRLLIAAMAIGFTIIGFLLKK